MRENGHLEVIHAEMEDQSVRLNFSLRRLCPAISGCCAILLSC